MKMNKKALLAIVLAAAIAVPAGIAGFFHFRPSADEEISKMKGIVAQHTGEEGSVGGEDKAIGGSEADALDKSAEGGIAQQPVPEGGEQGQPEQPAQEEQHVSVNVRDWKKYSSSYSYDHMTSAEQAMWTRISAAVEEYMNSGSLDAAYYPADGYYTTYAIRYGDLEMTREEAVSVAHWFQAVNPQYWFITPMTLSTSDSIYMGIFDVGADGDDRAKVTNEIFPLVDGFSSGISGTSYQKAQAVWDKVIEELRYQNGKYDQSIYPIMTERTAVCAGYAGLYSMMMNSMGVETMIVSSTNHAWNAVLMDDGQWYGADPTWGDSLGTDMLFLVDEATLKSLDSSKESHIVEGRRAAWSPALSGTSYRASSYDNTGSQEAVALSAPTGLAVEYTDASSGLFKWDSVKRADQYEVQIYKGSKKVGGGVLSSLKVKLTSLGTSQMTLKVRAVRNGANGAEYSDWASLDYTHVQQAAAAEPSQEPAKQEQPADYTPAVPANLRVSDSGSSYIQLEWDAVDGAQKYELKIYRDANFSSQRASGIVSATRAKLNGFSEGQDAYVQVRAIRNEGGQDWYSGWATVKGTARTVQQAQAAAPAQEQQMPAPSQDSAGLASEPSAQSEEQEPEALSAPSGLSYEKRTETSCKISWGAVVGAQKYEIEIYKDEVHASKLVGGIVNGTTVVINNFVAGRDYYARVRAVGETTSDWSPLTISVEKAVPVMQVPSGLSSSKVSASERRVSWTAVTGAETYEVQISTKSDFSKIAAQTTTKNVSLKLSKVGAYPYYIRVRACGTVDGTPLQSEWAQTSFDGSK